MLSVLQVRFVGGNFLHLETLARGLYERREHRDVGIVLLSDLHRRNDVSFHSNANVNLDPFPLKRLTSVLVREPAFKLGVRYASSAAGAVYDRAFPLDREDCAVTDRAYNRRQSMRVRGAASELRRRS